MKTVLLLPAGVFAFWLLATPARAADPQTVVLSPELQALLVQLQQTAATAQAEAAPVPDAAPAAPVTPSNRPPKSSSPAVSSLQIGRLATGRLATASLAPSAPLGGRGTTGGFPRLTDDDWRLLFPVKQSRP